MDLLGTDVFRSDLTEAPGLDDLHDPSGPILEAQRLAADLFGSECCWFLVNGSTCGNEAMILAAVREGQKILIDRCAHLSAVSGLILSGTKPVWLPAGADSIWRVPRPADAQTIKEYLDADPDIRAVFITSPNYYGVCSPLRRIADICHSRGVPLLVDEAHGTHLYFSDLLPEGALACGADLVVQSTHKTAGSLTQSSMLHLQGGLLDRSSVDDALRMVMSSSPSYVLMASLDGARQQLALHGRKLLSEAVDLAFSARGALAGISGVEVLSPGTWSTFPAPGMDILRIVISAERTGLSGMELKKRIFEESGVCAELADVRNVVFVITWGNTPDDIRRLADAVKRAVGSAGEHPGPRIIRDPRAGLSLPEQVMTPRQAWCAPKISVPLGEACGRVSGEHLVPYPPGVPMLCAGERITDQTVDELLRMLEEGISVHGPADPCCGFIRVVDDGKIS